MTREQVDIEYEILSHRAYELYKKDWCVTRGYSYAEVCQADKEDVEYHGEMFVCKAEFEDNEFLDEEYMKYLLSEEDFWCWKKVMEYIDVN